MGSVNMNSVMRKVLRTKKVRREAHSAVDQQIRKIKRQVLNYFDNHYFTRKIKEGPDPEQRKNLFGFIGFHETSNPIDPVRDVLEGSFRVVKRPVGFTSRSWTYKVIIPSEEALRKISPMPWGLDDSWLDAVENGIPDLVRYLNKAAGRSGAGVQVKGDIRERQADFEPKDYLLTKLRQVRKELKRAGATR